MADLDRLVDRLRSSPPAPMFWSVRCAWCGDRYVVPDSALYSQAAMAYHHLHRVLVCTSRRAVAWRARLRVAQGWRRLRERLWRRWTACQRLPRYLRRQYRIGGQGPDG